LTCGNTTAWHDSANRNDEVMIRVKYEEDDMKRVQITKCEAEVMDVVWQRDCVTVNDVVDSLDRDLAYTTVMTTLKILEEKKIVSRGEKIGRAYTYRPVVSREQARQGMVRELADRLFGGSVQSLVLSLVSSEDISTDDIADLKKAARKIDRSK
jgi:predicted transcriptional regulator